MSIILEQRYERVPTLGYTLGRHKVKATAINDTVTVRPLLNANSVRIANNETTPATVATSVITLVTAIPAVNDTITVGGIKYTWKTTLTGGAGTGNVPYEVLSTTSVTVSGQNLTKAINATGTSGTTYGAGTLANPLVTAADGSAGVVNLTSIQTGLSGKQAVAPILVFATPATASVSTLPTGGVGGVATCAPSTGVISIGQVVVGDIIELVTYHPDINNYSSVG